MTSSNRETTKHVCGIIDGISSKILDTDTALYIYVCVCVCSIYGKNDWNKLLEASVAPCIHMCE